MTLTEIRQEYDKSALPMNDFQDWVIPPVENINEFNIQPKSGETSLHYISEGCSKKDRKGFFKTAYENVMASCPNASYRERLDIAKKTVAELQQLNPDIDPHVLKSLKRSFAARTGCELTRLRTEIKKADIIQTLPNGKEIHSNHNWSCAVNRILESQKDDKQSEKAILIKIIDTRNQLKSIINTRMADKTINVTPSEILKITEAHIAQLISRQKDIDIKTVLERGNIEQLLNMTDSISSNDMGQTAFYNRNHHTLESWIESVIERQ